MRSMVCGATIAMIASASAAASDQSSIRDIYIEAAAVAEKCGAAPLDDAGAAKLAAVIAAETKETTPASEVIQLLAKERAVLGANVDCNGPLTSIHVEFFNNVVRPRMDAQGAPNS